MADISTIRTLTPAGRDATAGELREFLKDLPSSTPITVTHGNGWGSGSTVYTAELDRRGNGGW